MSILGNPPLPILTGFPIYSPFCSPEINPLFILGFVINSKKSLTFSLYFNFTGCFNGSSFCCKIFLFLFIIRQGRGGVFFLSLGNYVYLMGHASSHMIDISLRRAPSSATAIFAYILIRIDWTSLQSCIIKKKSGTVFMAVEVFSALSVTNPYACMI